MYEAFYGLKERPFNLTPDPRFLFLSEKHKEAFAHLLFGIKNRTGFVMVTGEIGTGKTTICRTLLGQLDDETEVAFIFNPCLSPAELLRKINEDFGIDSRAETMKGLIDELNAHLLDRASKGKNCVLVIDEAQNLNPSVLEQVRLLSNLETETAKLIQIVLIGQPELAQSLELPELRQLNQRITARYHLKALDAEETLQYIAYRLRVAGGRRKIRFTRSAVRAVYAASKGTPRVINAVCDRALLIGYTVEATDLTARMVRRAAKEIRGERFKKPRTRPRAWRNYLPNLTATTVTALVCFTLISLFGPWGWPKGYDTGSLSARKPDAGVAAPHETPPAPNAAIAKVQDAAGPSLAETFPAPKPASEFARALSDLAPSVARNAAALAVLRTWNLALVGGYPQGDSPEQWAAFATGNGLTMEQVELNLDQLTAINLPAFIKVAGDQDALWVALLGLEGDSARVTAGIGETVLAGKDELEARYGGQALVLWRDLSPDSPILKQGMSGAAVRAFQEQLYGLHRITSAPGGRFDEDTAAAVRAIQKEVGLTEDGVVGRQTRMVLSSWLTPTAPSLTAKAPAPIVPESGVASASAVPVLPSTSVPVASPVENASSESVVGPPPAPSPAIPDKSPAEDTSSSSQPPQAAPAEPAVAPTPLATGDTSSSPGLDAGATPAPPSFAPAPGAVAVEELPPLGGSPLSLPPLSSAAVHKEVTPPALPSSPFAPFPPPTSSAEGGTPR